MSKALRCKAARRELDRGDGTQLRVPLKALPPGTYKVIWRVLSVDTHRTQGRLHLPRRPCNGSCAQ